jgi:hypothetical protein
MTRVFAIPVLVIGFFMILASIPVCLLACLIRGKA